MHMRLVFPIQQEGRWLWSLFFTQSADSPYETHSFIFIKIEEIEDVKFRQRNKDSNLEEHTSLGREKFVPDFVVPNEPLGNPL